MLAYKDIKYSLSARSVSFFFVLPGWRDCLGALVADATANILKAFPDLS